MPLSLASFICSDLQPDIWPEGGAIIHNTQTLMYIYLTNWETIVDWCNFSSNMYMGRVAWQWKSLGSGLQIMNNDTIFFGFITVKLLFIIRVSMVSVTVVLSGNLLQNNKSHYHIAGKFGWEGSLANCLWFPNLKQFKLVHTINNLLADY